MMPNMSENIKRNDIRCLRCTVVSGLCFSSDLVPQSTEVVLQFRKSILNAEFGNALQDDP
ncbi:hypothetical protein BGW80DRAFT_1386997 [Lactifluus volemus]|nr:hypothetical protein BGW80DRAFT_1386997 [Lactifluus volemus]